MKNLIILLLAIVITGASHTTKAQDMALKTNLLSDAVLNPNIGMKWDWLLSGRWMLSGSSMLGICRMTGDGSIERCSREFATGSATASVRAFLDSICMVANTTLVVSTVDTIYSALMPGN